MSRSLIHNIFAFALLTSFVCAMHSVAAETAVAKVTYVSAEVIYLDAGRQNNLHDGQKGLIQRNSKEIAHIEITALSDHTASCRILDQTARPRTGDDAVFTIVQAETPAVAVPPVKSTAPQQETTTPKTHAKRPTATRLSGRIGIQWYAQNDRSSLNYDYFQPSLVARFKAASLFGSHYALSVRLRTRRIYRPETLNDNRWQAWDNRIYEVSLSYADLESPVGFQLGRIMAGKISGIGYLDGVYGEYNMSSKFSVGTFGGTQPDLRTTGIQTQTRKAGFFAVCHSDKSAQTDFSLTGALAGEYTDGQISREFIYQQASLTRGSRFAVFQSAEININRGWLRQTEGRTLKLANLLTNVRYSPARIVTFNIGYDGYANYRTWETHDTPDSLFDEAMRKGYRAGMEFNLPLGLHSDVRGTLRDDASGGKLYRSASFGLATHRIFHGRIGIGIRHNYFESKFTDGRQPSANISFIGLRGSELRIQIGRTIYDYHNNLPRAVTDWWRTSLDFSISRRLYGSAYYEFYHGTVENAARLFIETGVRI